ncbi:MAG TPA: hypothetical protein VLN45_05365, partial [Ignavibacteriaceae bacterium]|nr:hypothetical protein [Ignavibacteriaceae bacterium]
PLLMEQKTNSELEFSLKSLTIENNLSLMGISRSDDFVFVLKFLSDLIWIILFIQSIRSQVILLSSPNLIPVKNEAWNAIL